MQPKRWLTKPGGIAERLRALHDATGMSGKQLAEQLGWAPSKVSRIRKGINTPTVADIAAWAKATDATAAVDELNTVLADALTHRRLDFGQRMSDGQAAVQRDYNALVEESEVIKYFETAWIPGFLQTRDYARRVFEEMVDLHGPKDDIDRSVAVRMKRQALLGDKGRRFELLVDEPVLYRTAVSAEIMVPQLYFLLTWLNTPDVYVGILPLRGSYQRIPQNSFQMYDDLVVVESFDGETEGKADLYERVFNDLWAAALVGVDAREPIKSAIKAWSQDTPWILDTQG